MRQRDLGKKIGVYGGITFYVARRIPKDGINVVARYGNKIKPVGQPYVDFEDAERHLSYYVQVSPITNA